MQLTKAWDKDALVEGLKSQGLPVLEDSAEKLAKTFFDWAKQSIELEGGMFKTVGKPIIEAAEEYAMSKIDDISKADDQPAATAQLAQPAQSTPEQAGV